MSDTSNCTITDESGNELETRKVTVHQVGKDRFFLEVGSWAEVLEQLGGEGKTVRSGGEDVRNLEGQPSEGASVTVGLEHGKAGS